MTLKLLLADDHTMLREGLRRSMETEGFDVVGEAQDGGDAVQLARALHPDVILMDVSMPVLDGIEATRRIRTEEPDIQVVMLTMHADREVIEKALAAGAAGYLVKDCTTTEIAGAVRMAADHDTTVSSDVARSMLTEAGAPSDGIITAREAEVLQLIAEGASTTEVAEKLYISAKTVKNHLASIYQKLESRDRTQAVLKAVRMGIIRLS